MNAMVPVGIGVGHQTEVFVCGVVELQPAQAQHVLGEAKEEPTDCRSRRGVVPLRRTDFEALGLLNGKAVPAAHVVAAHKGPAIGWWRVVW